MLRKLLFRVRGAAGNQRFPLWSQATQWMLVVAAILSTLPACDPALMPPDPTGTLTTATPDATLPSRTPARVTEVVDGDTIRVEVNGEVYPVRYIGIDAPETVHPSEPVQWMGPEASEANRRLVAGQIVYLEQDVSDTDRYGRLLRYVFLADGTFVNAELVRLGYALSSTYPPDVRHQELLRQMQREAREMARGLWGPTPVPE